MSTETLPSLSRPEDWWRHLCWVGEHRIALCGDLPADHQAALTQLEGWIAAGVTHIVDLRGEWNDEDLVAAIAPELGYSWLGTHDDGGPQDPAWFDAGVETILEALSHPDANVVVHCHMGVNRAPSLGFAALLALGVAPVTALDTIRTARPIAAAHYAEDAVAWWATRNGGTARAVSAARAVVRNWHDENPCDVGWIISRIRRAERTER